MRAHVSMLAVAGCAVHALAGTTFSNDLSSEADLAPDLMIADTSDAMRAVTFSASGAQFGTAFAGNDGRNMIRTNAMDFGNADFTAEMTADLSGGGRVFFGMGGGNVGTFGTPDWDVANSVWVEQGIGVTTLFTFDFDAGGPLFEPNPLAAPTALIFRLRMSYDAGAGMLTFEQDDDYMGGPFSADSTTAIDVTALFDGGEATSLFIGGGSGATVRDFDVTVVPAPGSVALFACSGLVAARRRRG